QMNDTIQKRLAALGITLPSPAAPAANYVPYVAAGKLLMVSGQLPIDSGKLTATGLLGRDLDTEAGKQAARQCAINVLAQLQVAAGGLENITRLVKITVY